MAPSGDPHHDDSFFNRAMYPARVSSCRNSGRGDIGTGIRFRAVGGVTMNQSISDL